MNAADHLEPDEERARGDFESAWERGERPSLLGVLQMFSAEKRQRLLPVLLHVELHHRKRLGDTWSSSQYVQMFPDQAEVVQGVAARFIDTALPGDGATLTIGGVVDSPAVDQTPADQSPNAVRSVARPDGTTESLPPDYTPVQSAHLANMRGGIPGAQSAAGLLRRFLPIREHAQGGLGKVFVARDTELNREVALKEIQPRHADNRSAQTRFVLEAEVTGGLEHPGIVPIYGLGKYPDGRPYYAMRFIRGESMKEAIDEYHGRQGAAPAGEQALALRKLLKHFVDVCHAIDYAHSRGVLHRDIKPGNVMLGKHGETLVVDWGLAKILGVDSEPDSSPGEAPLQPLSGSAVEATMMGSTVGTLQYMSPEQAEGNLDILGPETDVFSLGATLYELLTGKMAYQAVPRDKILDFVKRADFPPPREVRADIPRPLNAICLKAMARETKDRDARPSALIADIERYLADEPVTAYEESMWDRLARFIRRYRQYVLASLLALGAIAVIATGAAFVANRAWKNESLAHDKAEKARDAEEKAKEVATSNYRIARDSVDRWLTGATQALRYYPGFQQMRTRLLEAAAEDYERFAQFKSDDPMLELERGRAWLRLGDAQSFLGKSAPALESWREAAGVFGEQAAKAKEDKPLFVQEQVAALARQGESLFALGKPDAALKVFSTADALLPELGDVAQWDAKRVATVGNLHLHRTTLELELLQRENATASLKRAADVLQHLPKEGELDLSAEEIRLTQYKLQARLALLVPDLAAAAAALRAAVARTEELVRISPPDEVRVRDWGASSQIELAAVLHQLGESQQELAAYQAAGKHYQELVHAIPDAPLFLELQALTWNDQAYVQWELEQLTEGSVAAEEAARTFRQLAEAQPDMARYREEFATSLETVAKFRADQGKADDARELLKIALQKLDELIAEVPEAPAYRQRRAIARSQLAKLNAEDQAEATALFETSLAEMEELVKLAPEALLFQQSLAHVHWEYGWWLEEQGTSESAALQFKSADEAWQSALQLSPSPDVNHDYARSLLDRPTTTAETNAQALALAKQAIAAAADNPEFAWTFGWALCRTGDAVGWKKWCADHQLPAENPPAGRIRDRYLRAYAVHLAGDHAEAVKVADEADALENSQRPGNQELLRLGSFVRRQLASTQVDQPEPPK